MDIEKGQIQKIISQMEASEAPFYEACQMLRELIEGSKWEPKGCSPGFYIMGYGAIDSHSARFTNDYILYGNTWPTKELAETARDMNKRNQYILQYKTEKGFGDGPYGLEFKNKWFVINSYYKANPELTFETREQAEETIKALRMNDE